MRAHDVKEILIDKETIARRVDDHFVVGYNKLSHIAKLTFLDN